MNELNNSRIQGESKMNSVSQNQAKDKEGIKDPSKLLRPFGCGMRLTFKGEAMTRLGICVFKPNYVYVYI